MTVIWETLLLSLKDKEIFYFAKLDIIKKKIFFLKRKGKYTVC